MLEIKMAEYVGNYSIYLVFNNGWAGIADLKQTILSDRRPIFSQLKDQANFSNFKVEHGTLIWSDELDLASEYLFYLAFKGDPTLQEQFKAWGYSVEGSE